MNRQTMREVAMRLATNSEVDRRLKESTRSRFFWLYSISWWNPDAFVSCLLGASLISLVGVGIFSSAALLVNSAITFQALLSAIGVGIEYFLVGLVITWPISLGSWYQLANRRVITIFVFKLYRKNKTTEDLSTQDLCALFPDDRVPSDITLKSLMNSIKKCAVMRWLPFFASLSALIGWEIAIIEHFSAVTNFLYPGSLSFGIMESVLASGFVVPAVVARGIVIAVSPRSRAFHPS